MCHLRDYIDLLSDDSVVNMAEYEAPKAAANISRPLHSAVTTETSPCADTFWTMMRRGKNAFMTDY